MSCINQYCWINGKTTGQHTNSSCSCLRVLPMKDQLAIKQRIMKLESGLIEAQKRFTAEDVRQISIKVLDTMKEFGPPENEVLIQAESAFVLLYDRLLSEEKKR